MCTHSVCVCKRDCACLFVCVLTRAFVWEQSVLLSPSTCSFFVCTPPTPTSPRFPLLPFTIVTNPPCCCCPFSVPSLTPFPLSFSSLYISPLPCLRMSVCVLWAASQDDGEIRATLGTSSQWRGLRPRDALAAISQGSPVIASPDGLQVTSGKRIDRPICPFL